MASFAVEPGGDLIIAAGADDIEDDVMRGFIVSTSSAQIIEYTIASTTTSSEADYVGLTKATVTVRGGPAGLIGTTVSVYDHSQCIFDEIDMEGYTGWAYWSQYRTLDATKACEVLTPFHWAAFNRCCAPDSGTYRDCA